MKIKFTISWVNKPGIHEKLLPILFTLLLTFSMAVMPARNRTDSAVVANIAREDAKHFKLNKTDLKNKLPVFELQIQ